MIARPFLDIRREALRAYLETAGVRWIEDPSNNDLAFERVRLRRAPLSAADAAALLRRSDAAAAERDRLHRAALALIDAAAQPLAWGGAILDAPLFAQAGVPVALKALETLVLAASGAGTPPDPAALERLLAALSKGRSGTCAGAHLTDCAVLGRDAGAAGRADGAAAAAELNLCAGETGVFDGRWCVTAQRAVTIRVHGSRSAGPAGDIPPALRPGLAAVRFASDGERPRILGVDAPADMEAALLWRDRINARLLPQEPPTWFDGAKVAAQVRAALAKPARRPNMTVYDGPRPDGAGPGDGRRKEDDT